MKIIRGKDGMDIAVIEGDQWISAWVEQSGRLDHDQSALPLILRHIKPGDVVVDGGAFIGDHTVAYARAVGETGGYVYAFEPNPEAHECLKFNVRGLLVTALNAGLSDRRHDVFLAGGANAGATYAVDAEYPSLVSCRALDGMTFHRLNLIKLDIEGFEVRALKGAAETIRRHKPVLVVEVNEGALNRQGSTGAELLDLIRSYGYRVENLYPEQPLSGPQFDILARPL